MNFSTLSYFLSFFSPYLRMKLEHGFHQLLSILAVLGKCIAFANRFYHIGMGILGGTARTESKRLALGKHFFDRIAIQHLHYTATGLIWRKVEGS